MREYFRQLTRPRFFKVLAGVLGILTLTMLFGVLVSQSSLFQKKDLGSSTLSSPEPSMPVSVDAGQLPRTLLLMGYGGGAHAGGKLTDSMIVVRVVPEKQKIFLVSIPRDLWVPLELHPGQTTWSKINAAYAIGSDDLRYPGKPLEYTGLHGGGTMAKKAAQEVVGFPIEKYATMSFQGFEKAIDALGGITVDVQRAFTDTQYPIAGKEDDPCGKTPDEEQRIAATLSAQLREKEYLCRYESISFVKGNMFMDGATALKFVRSRHAAGDAGDFHRSERQRQVLLAMKKKILSIQFLPKSIGFVQSLAADFQTDLTANDLEFIVGQANIWQAYSVTTISLSDQNVLQMGTSKDGQSILVPKSGSESFAAIQEWITAEMGKY